MSPLVTASTQAFTGVATPNSLCYSAKRLPSAFFRTKHAATMKNSLSRSPSWTAPSLPSPISSFFQAGDHTILPIQGDQGVSISTPPSSLPPHPHPPSSSSSPRLGEGPTPAPPQSHAIEPSLT